MIYSITPIAGIPPKILCPSFKLVTAGSTEPVTTADALAHARITDSGETTYMAACVTSARAYVEMMTGLSLSNEIRQMMVSDWAYAFEFDRSPVASITSVKYYPADYSAAVTVSASDYILPESIPYQIRFKDTYSFPALATRPDAVTVIYQLSAQVAPAALISAIKIIAADLYENRTEEISGTIVSRFERLKDIILAHRIGGFAN